VGVKYGCVQQNELKLLVAVMGGWYGGSHFPLCQGSVFASVQMNFGPVKLKIKGQ
jgi:hypothetical protein